MLFKKPTFYFAIVGTAATAALAMRLNTAEQIQPPPIQPPVNPYEASVAASGIIEALSENVSIGVPSAGLVMKVHVKVWDTVTEGQPLFTLDSRDLEAQLKVDEASVAVAAATLERLKDQLARLKSVNDPRAVSRDEVRTRENDVAVANAQLQAARAKVTQDIMLIERLTVRAPKAAAVLQVNIRPGEYASATPKNPAVMLGDMQRMQVRADVDEQNANRLQPGQTATAYIKGDTTMPIPLRFERIEPFVVPKTSLTGSSTERVDTRVLQVIYSFERPEDRTLYVGQQMDLFVRADTAPATKLASASNGCSAQQ